MGKIIKVKTSEILPSQDFLKRKTVEYILDCIKKKKNDKLPPTPIVRNDPDSSKYIAIDGHNLIAVYDLMKKDINVFLVDSRNDELKEVAKSSIDAVKKRNREVFEKYDRVVENVKMLKSKKIDSFETLRIKSGLVNF